MTRLNGTHGNDWATIAKSFPGRTNKHCRGRCVTLSAKKNKTKHFTPTQDQFILHEHYYNHKGWADISKSREMDGHSETAIKNRWDSYLEKNQQAQLHDRHGADCAAMDNGELIMFQ